MKIKKTRPRRDRATTTQHIIHALEQVIAEQGIERVGINLVAERANVSQALIYRYFGGFTNLLTYYVGMGHVFPNLTPDFLRQIHPISQRDLVQVWFRQAMQLFRKFRASKAAREVLKVNLGDSSLATAVSHKMDTEFTAFAQQLCFVQGGDPEAISAIVLGGLSYLTIMAHNNRSAISIDLRTEVGWQRVEEATKQIFKALAQSVTESSDAQVAMKSLSQPPVQGSLHRT